MATILAVDNEDSMLRMLRDALQRRGYRVLTAMRDIEAFTAVQQESIDLLVTDAQLSNISGPQLVENLSLFVGSVKVLYLSRDEPTPAIREQVEQGRAAFLNKSFNFGLIVETIETMLQPPSPPPRSTKQST